MSGNELGFGEVPHLSPGTSVGVILAEARAARDLTQDDVADQLNLSSRVIAAIESDDYAQLPGATFVRGYIRAYAKLVGVDEKSVLDGAADADGMSSRARRGRSGGVHMGPRRGRSWWGAAAGVSLVVIIGAVWWGARTQWLDLSQWVPTFGKPEKRAALLDSKHPAAALDVEPVSSIPALSDPQDASAAPASDEMQPAPSPTAAGTGAAGGARVGADWRRGAPATGGATGETALPADEPLSPRAARSEGTTLADRAVPQVGDEGAALRPVALASERGGQPDTAAPPGDPQPAQSAAVSTAPNDTAAPGGADTGAVGDPSNGDLLVLRTTDESWAEVVDADRNRLIFALLGGGEQHTLRGRAPFHLVLGNAPAVEVELNSHSFDAMRYIRPDQSARFSLGGGPSDG